MSCDDERLGEDDCADGAEMINGLTNAGIVIQIQIDDVTF